MPAANIDIEIEQGSKFNPIYTWKNENDNPVNVSDWTAKMEIRLDKSKTADKVHTVNDADFNLGDGTVQPVISAIDTDGFDFDWAWYDIEITPPSGAADSIRLTQGRVRLDKSVTD